MAKEVAMSTYVFQIQSLIILALYVYGVSLHKNRKKHSKIMTGAFIWDVILILQIELTRSAIKTAIKPMYNHVMLNIHIALAVTTVILFVVAMVFGRKILKGGNEDLLPKHRIIGYSALSFRLLTFVTSFFTVVDK